MGKIKRMKREERKKERKRKRERKNKEEEKCIASTANETKSETSQ